MEPASSSSRLVKILHGKTTAESDPLAGTEVLIYDWSASKRLLEWSVTHANDSVESYSRHHLRHRIWISSRQCAQRRQWARHSVPRIAELAKWFVISCSLAFNYHTAHIGPNIARLALMMNIPGFPRLLRTHFAYQYRKWIFRGWMLCMTYSGVKMPNANLKLHYIP